MAVPGSIASVASQQLSAAARGMSAVASPPPCHLPQVYCYHPDGGIAALVNLLFTFGKK
jgi:hypothetical protein